MIRGIRFYFLRGKEGLASDASDYNMAPSFSFYLKVIFSMRFLMYPRSTQPTCSYSVLVVFLYGLI